MSLRIGIDIGSTTVKVVVLDEQNKLPASPSIPSPVCWRANR